METLRSLCEKARLEERDLYCGKPPKANVDPEPIVEAPPVEHHYSSDKKRPPNAFFLFCNEKRADVQSANPTLSCIQISSLLAKMWKELDSRNADIYKAKAKALLAEYKQQNPESKYKKRKQNNNNKTFNKNVHPLQFFNQMFQKNPFLLQQLLDNDKNGKPDIAKLFCIE